MTGLISYSERSTFFSRQNQSNHCFTGESKIFTTPPLIGSGVILKVINNIQKDFSSHFLPSSNIKSTNHLLNDLRNHVGFNVSELAAILLVERPTIYEWLESNNEPSKKNQRRLNRICDFFEEWLKERLPTLKGYLHKNLGGYTLLDLLRKEKLNAELIRKTITVIKNTVISQHKKRSEREAELAATGFEPVKPEQKRKVLDRFTRKIG